MPKTGVKREGKPIQVYLESGHLVDFERVIADIDPFLSRAKAVIKLIRYATEKHWLPGYNQQVGEITKGEPMGNIGKNVPLTHNSKKGIHKETA